MRRRLLAFLLLGLLACSGIRAEQRFLKSPFNVGDTIEYIILRAAGYGFPAGIKLKYVIVDIANVSAGDEIQERVYADVYSNGFPVEKNISLTPGQDFLYMDDQWIQDFISNLERANASVKYDGDGNLEYEYSYEINVTSNGVIWYTQRTYEKRIFRDYICVYYHHKETNMSSPSEDILFEIEYATPDFVQQTTGTETTPTTTPTTATTTATKETKTGFPATYVAIGGGIAAICLVVALIVILRKRGEAG